MVAHAHNYTVLLQFFTSENLQQKMRSNFCDLARTGDVIQAGTCICFQIKPLALAQFA